MLICSISYRDAFVAFQIFAEQPHAVFLDGAAMQKDKGRFSYIATDPFAVMSTVKNQTTLNGKSTNDDPFTALEKELKKYRADGADAPVPFTGGAIGYLGYELGGYLERLPAPHPDKIELPAMIMGFYDTIAAFDHVRQKAWIISQGWPETDVTARHKRAENRADELAKKLESAPSQLPPLDRHSRGSWQPGMSRHDAERCVARIVEYIRAGDIFQANFTQRYLAARPKELTDFMLYRRVRELNPAPFAVFMRAGENVSIAGASPERFLRLKDGTVEAHPIKGTRPRDDNPVRDMDLAKELQQSAKDHSENLMIVDLMRNDLSRVCEPGSVTVPRLCELETFASVHHLTSVITGRMKASAGPVDLLRAAFPGGSITGAPKIRAMEIIHELEPVPRGVYCGCLGWIGFDRTMDMSMTIRTMTITGDTILAQAGGGIVADSTPADEYEECMVKIAPLLRAVTGEAR